MMNDTSFKVAIVTNNGSIISKHFGSSQYYEVFTVENGEITNRERREKFNPHAPGQGHRMRNSNNVSQVSGEDEHHNCSHNHEHNHEQHQHQHQHGLDMDSGNKHRLMLESISDCQYLLAGGMGWGIYQHLENANISPIVTDFSDIEQAVKAVIDKSIVNHSEKLH